MTTRPRFKAREMILLFLPVMLLGGVGWYFTRYPVKSDDGPWRVVVDEVKMVPITPREVFKGFDTKVAVKAHTIGKPDVPPDHKPTGGIMTGQNWRVVSSEGGLEKVLFTWKQKDRITTTTIAGSQDMPVGTAALKLASIPSSLGTLTLKGEVQAIESFNVHPAGRPAYARQILSKPVPFSIVVRKAGQTVGTPTISKDSPITVVKTEINEGQLLGTDPGDVLVIIKFSLKVAQTARIRKSFAESFTYLSDERGRKYTKIKMINTTRSAYGVPVKAKLLGASCSWDDNGFGFLNYDIPLSQIPQAAGRITLHSSFSINDSWPISVSIDVRDKYGRIIKNPTLKINRVH